MMRATGEGAAVWGKIRRHCAAGNTEEEAAVTGRLSESTVLACVDVSAWLTRRGLGETAQEILRSLTKSGHSPEQWLAQLQSMNEGDREALAAPAVAAKQEIVPPPSQSNFEEDL